MKNKLLILIFILSMFAITIPTFGYLVYCSRISSSSYTISEAISTLSSDGINGMWVSKVFDSKSPYGIVAVEGRFYMDGFLYKVVWETGNESAAEGAIKPPVESFYTSTFTKGYYSIDEQGYRFQSDSQVSVVAYRYYCGY